MTLSLPQFPDANLLTHSALKCWNACRRRYWFQYVLGVRRAWASEPLRMGNMWHVGVEMYESGAAISDALDAVRNAYLDQDRPPYLSEEEYAVEREKVLAMVQGHYERYKDDQILESLVVELPFQLPITNPETSRPTPNFLDAGKIDRLARLPDATIAVVERKTTSEDIGVDSDYWKALRNDPQISRYLRAARALGHDATKVVYDVMKKPGIRPKQVTKAERAHATANGSYFGLRLTEQCPERETPEMYGARLIADLRERPDFYFARIEIARIDADLEEFSYDLWQSQQDIRQATLKNRFVRNPSACLEPFRCEYLDVCSQLASRPDEIPDGFRRVERLHEELPSPQVA